MGKTCISFPHPKRSVYWEQMFTCKSAAEHKIHNSLLKGFESRIVLYPCNSEVLGHSFCLGLGFFGGGGGFPLRGGEVLPFGCFCLFVGFLFSFLFFSVPIEPMGSDAPSGWGEHRAVLVMPQAGGRSPEHGPMEPFWGLTTGLYPHFHFPVSPVSICISEVSPAFTSDTVLLIPFHPFPSSLPSYSYFLLTYLPHAVSV